MYPRFGATGVVATGQQNIELVENIPVYLEVCPCCFENVFSLEVTLCV